MYINIDVLINVNVKYLNADRAPYYRVLLPDSTFNICIYYDE